MLHSNANLENHPDAAFRFEALMAAFSDRRSLVQERMRSLNGQTPVQFLGTAYRYLARQEGSPDASTRYVAEMLVNHPMLVDLLSDPRILGREEGLLVMRAITQVAPGLAGILLQHFLETEVREEDLPRLFRILELTSAVDLVGRTNMQLTRLLASKNPRVRAKTVQLLVGSTGSAEAAVRLLEDEDPRVQANVIECLWPHARTTNAQKIFRSHMASATVRVATNSLIGLVKAGDSQARLQLIANLRGKDSALAKAAAWAMGFLGDQEFKVPLDEALRSGNVLIRGGALSALVRLNQKRMAAVAPDGSKRELESIPLEKLREGVESWNLWRRESGLSMPSLENAQLRGSMLVGADFSFCSLVDANLQGARLNLCNFFCADLSGTDFSDAQMERCDLRGCETDDQTRFDETMLRGSNLYGLDLRGVLMRGANLEDADLQAILMDSPGLQREIA